jgi:hypothetical protein
MDKEELKKLLIRNAANITPKVQMPTALQMAKNIVRTTVDSVKGIAEGNPLNVSNDDANRRKNICEGCEFYQKTSQRCTKCGCFMAVKTYIKAAVCPIGKW